MGSLTPIGADPCWELLSLQEELNRQQGMQAHQFNQDTRVLLEEIEAAGQIQSEKQDEFSAHQKVRNIWSSAHIAMQYLGAAATGAAGMSCAQTGFAAVSAGTTGGIPMLAGGICLGAASLLTCANRAMQDTMEEGWEYMATCVTNGSLESQIWFADKMERWCTLASIVTGVAGMVLTWQAGAVQQLAKPTVWENLTLLVEKLGPAAQSADQAFKLGMAYTEKKEAYLGADIKELGRDETSYRQEADRIGTSMADCLNAQQAIDQAIQGVVQGHAIVD